MLKTYLHSLAQLIQKMAVVDEGRKDCHEHNNECRLEEYKSHVNRIFSQGKHLLICTSLSWCNPSTDIAVAASKSMRMLSANSSSRYGTVHGVVGTHRQLGA